MSDESIITFGQLLKIKREKMNLNLVQAIEQTNVTNLSNIERNNVKPMKKTLTKLIKFYRLTDDEIKSCKEKAGSPKVKENSNGITNAIEIINSVLQRVGNMSEKGLLAATIKKDAIENLTNAKILLIDVQIVDNLI